jgi:excisionase family DNA binding protein
MTATSIPALVGVDELADHLGTSPRHVRRPIAERRVPYLKVGGYVRFDPPRDRGLARAVSTGHNASTSPPGPPYHEDSPRVGRATEWTVSDEP